MHYIYVIRNSINDKVYVGQTSKFSQRKAGHLYSARRGDQRSLYVAMREFGVDKFAFELLEECVDPHVASQREEHWVKHFDAFNAGYNLTNGGGYHVGNRGRKFSEEHKRKISEAHKGKTFSEETRRKIGRATSKRLRENHPMRGKHFSDEALSNMRKGRRELCESPKWDEIRARISETLKGTILSDETKRKISNAGKGRKHSPETIAKMKSRIFTEEHRRKLSEAAKLREERRRQECD